MGVGDRVAPPVPAVPWASAITPRISATAIAIAAPAASCPSDEGPEDRGDASDPSRNAAVTRRRRSASTSRASSGLNSAMRRQATGRRPNVPHHRY